MGERILEGSLRAISVPDVLTFVNLLKKTGVLTIRCGEAVRKLYWERGELVFASSSVPEESLGAFLLRHGKITQEQNDEAGRRVEPGKRQGKVLVQMGVLTPKQLWWAVKNQVLEIIYDLFRLRDGFFFFEETADINEEKIKLSTSTTNIVMEGIRRLDEWPRIRELIPSHDLVPLLTPSEARDPSVKFLEGEMEILALVDGQRDMRALIHASHLDEFETLRVLMSLVLARYIQVPGAAPGQGEDDVEDVVELETVVDHYNALFVRIGGELERRLSHDERAALFASALSGCDQSVLEGSSFDAKGRLVAKVLTANVADLPAERRKAALSGALENLLSFLLFESSKHLDPAQRAEVYRLVELRPQAAT